MRNTFGFIAIIGIIAAMCGRINEITGCATMLCIILYIFYPTDNTQKYE